HPLRDQTGLGDPGRLEQRPACVLRVVEIHGLVEVALHIGLVPPHGHPDGKRLTHCVCPLHACSARLVALPADSGMPLTPGAGRPADSASASAAPCTPRPASPPAPGWPRRPAAPRRPAR